MKLLDDLSLPPTSHFEFWAGNWQIIDINTPLLVERGRDVLLRIRRSILKPLSDIACLQLEDYLLKQPQRLKTKRGDIKTLVSPPKKKRRMTEQGDALEAQGSRSEVEVVVSSLFSSLLLRLTFCELADNSRRCQVS